MYVKLKAGNRAGEVVDMKYETAKTLVDLGRAERVNFDRPEPEQGREDVAIPADPKNQTPGETHANQNARKRGRRRS